MLKKNLEQREKPELIPISIRKAGWTWMRISLVCWSAVPHQENDEFLSWARNALMHKAAWSSSQQYEALLAVLEQTNRL